MRRAVMAGAILLMTGGISWAWDPHPTRPADPATTTGVAGSVTGGTASATGTGIGTARSRSTSGATANSGGNTQTTNINGGVGQGGSSGGGGSVGGVAFALPSIGGGGQCTNVGIGPGGFGSNGGGGGLVTWESTNCRNYFIATALLSVGRTEEGVRLLASITPEARAAIQPPSSPTAQPSYTSQPVLPAPGTVRPAWERQ